jgi:outer membrane receptor for ferrienterochelin and colicin
MIRRALLSSLLVLAACGDATTLIGPEAEAAFERARAEIAEGAEINIRGTPSGYRSPMIFIDGEPADTTDEALRRLSPEDIERIEVIKGVVARETYGEDGANGVIRIFTKRH